MSMSCGDKARLLFPELTDKQQDDIIWGHTCFHLLIGSGIPAGDVQNRANEQMEILRSLPKKAWPNRPLMDWGRSHEKV